MDEIEIVNYDPTWPDAFEAEAKQVRSALGADQVLAIEHAGSTAIPGLPAKPIIDIYVAVASIEEAKKRFVKPLETIGYLYWADNPRKNEMFFVKGMPPYGTQRTHHIHVSEFGSESWQRPLLFRDYLRQHDDEAQRYRELKFSLASHYRSDRERYTTAKDAYVEAVIAKALQDGHASDGSS